MEQGFGSRGAEGLGFAEDFVVAGGEVCDGQQVEGVGFQGGGEAGRERAGGEDREDVVKTGELAGCRRRI